MNCRKYDLSKLKKKIEFNLDQIVRIVGDDRRIIEREVRDGTPLNYFYNNIIRTIVNEDRMSKITEILHTIENNTDSNYYISQIHDEMIILKGEYEKRLTEACDDKDKLEGFINNYTLFILWFEGCKINKTVEV